MNLKKRRVVIDLTYRSQDPSSDVAICFLQTARAQ